MNLNNPNKDRDLMNNKQETNSILRETEPSTTAKKAISHGKAISSDGDTPTIPALALKQIVELCPNGELISIQLDGTEVVQSYAQIWDRATRFLGGLRKLGLQPGNPVILQVDRAQDFAPAFWSCFMGGFVPLPVPIAPNYQEQNQCVAKLHHSWQLLEHPIVLTTSKLTPQIRTALGLHDENKVAIATVETLEAHQPDIRLHQNQLEELGLFLLSSGTTGKPKLVTFNCRTVVNRLLKHQTRDSNSQQKVALSWLPLAHISGLRTALPNPNIQKKIDISTEAILQNPLLWLDIIEQYRVTNTSATNFLLGLVNENLNKNTENSWNLSSLQKIGIGAEPIVAKTVRTFLKLLTPHGLQSNVIRPGYGLSECGVITSSDTFSLTKTTDDDRLVEIGKPTPGHSIRIVDGDDRLLEEGQVGRIQVIGPTMTSGYHHSPEQNQELFTSDGWLNTGDLGFLRDRRLTITGREKEIVIINALNYHSLEIELAVEGVEGVEPSYTAAVATRKPSSNTDELVIFFHTSISDEKLLANLLKQIRRNIVRKFGVNPTCLIPIEREAIPRTATGKMQKKELLQRFEAGEFDPIIVNINHLIKYSLEGGFIAPNTPVEQQLADIWMEVLGLERVGIHDNFFELGGHSLLATQVISRIRQTSKVELPLRSLFEDPTVNELGSRIENILWTKTVPDSSNNKMGDYEEGEL